MEEEWGFAFYGIREKSAFADLEDLRKKFYLAGLGRHNGSERECVNQSTNRSHAET